MNYKILLSTTLIFSTLLTQLSCKRDCIEGQGSVLYIDKTPNNFTFDKIEISEGEFDVEIIQDTAFMVELKSQPNISSYFEAYKSGNTLILNQTTRKCIETDRPVKFIVHLPLKANLIELYNYGSGYTHCYKLETTQLYIKNEGSGDIKFENLYADDFINANIYSSGNIDTGYGKTYRSQFINSGSGTIYADDIISEKADASTRASGNIYLYTLRNLDANISGSGSIYYKGSPKVFLTGQGSGELYRL